MKESIITFWRKRKPNHYVDLIWPILVVFTSSLYPTTFLYFNNIGEAKLVQTIAPFLITLTIVAVCWLVLWLMFGAPELCGVLAALFVVLFMNYGYLEAGIQKLLPQMKYWHIVTVLLVIYLHICLAAVQWMKKDIIRTICQIVTIVFSSLIIVNTVSAAPIIMKKIEFVARAVEPVRTPNAMHQLQDAPNVYVIILDEYSNFETIQKYYNYDNKSFYDFLIDRGFNISLNSKNESMDQLTIFITTNYLNLDYIVNDSMTWVEATPHRENPPLFKLFHDYGYQIEFYSKLNPIKWMGEVGSSRKTKTQVTNEFIQLYFDKTAVGIFLKNTFTKDEEVFWDGFQFWNQLIEISQEPIFAYVHTLGAHSPFLFNEDGEAAPISEKENWSDKQYYVGHYKFVTSIVMESIDKLLAHDPDSVIILMSDHSMRNTHNAQNLPIVSMEDKVKILNAVYYRGQILDDFKDQSGVNTLRLILDHVLGTQLGVVEVP